MQEFLFYVGMVAGFVLPFFNIPLILKIRRNRSARDISLIWAWGILACVTLMLPQSLLSPDFGFKIFGIMNFALFVLTFVHVLYYRKGR